MQFDGIYVENMSNESDLKTLKALPLKNTAFSLFLSIIDEQMTRELE